MNKNKYLLISLDDLPVEIYMNIVYDILINYPEDIIYYNLDLDTKLEKIDFLLKYFEETEEFEKCQKIQEFKSTLSELN